MPRCILKRLRRRALKRLICNWASSTMIGMPTLFWDRFQVGIGLDQVGGLDLQFLIDGEQFFIGRLQFFVGHLELFVGRLQFFIGRLDFLVERLHFLV